MHIHWHKTKEYRGCFAYLECRCGDRKAVRVAQGMMGPDNGWIETGEFTPPPTEPPPKPSDADRSARPMILPPPAFKAPVVKVLDLDGNELNAELVFALHQKLSREERRRFSEMVASGIPVDVPLDETTAPVHYEGDTSST